LEQFLQTYGYWAVLLGTFIEGETILILAGFAAHRGYLDLPLVLLAAFAGSLMGDQFFFYLGRRHAEAFIRRRPVWAAKLERARRLMDRHRTPLILGFRFLYGFRTVMPFAIGISRTSVARFVLLNAAGALVWSVAVGGGGYLFGNALELLLGNLKHYESALFGLIAVAGAGVWGVYLLRRCRPQGR
jgi:membrane protein DedA with SNARE-associated domain